jgi:hypothetical protein
VDGVRGWGGEAAGGMRGGGAAGGQSLMGKLFCCGGGRGGGVVWVGEEEGEGGGEGGANLHFLFLHQGGVFLAVYWVGGGGVAFLPRDFRFHWHCVTE